MDREWSENSVYIGMDPREGLSECYGQKMDRFCEREKVSNLRGW